MWGAAVAESLLTGKIVTAVAAAVVVVVVGGGGGGGLALTGCWLYSATAGGPLLARVRGRLIKRVC